jgi:hypothetical protein
MSQPVLMSNINPAPKTSIDLQLIKFSSFLAISPEIEIDKELQTCLLRTDKVFSISTMRYGLDVVHAAAIVNGFDVIVRNDTYHLAPLKSNENCKNILPDKTDVHDALAGC